MYLCELFGYTCYVIINSLLLCYYLLKKKHNLYLFENGKIAMTSLAKEILW